MKILPIVYPIQPIIAHYLIKVHHYSDTDFIRNSLSPSVLYLSYYQSPSPTVMVHGFARKASHLLSPPTNRIKRPKQRRGGERKCPKTLQSSACRHYFRWFSTAHQFIRYLFVCNSQRSRGRLKIIPAIAPLCLRFTSVYLDFSILLQCFPITMYS